MSSTVVIAQINPSPVLRSPPGTLHSAQDTCEGLRLACTAHFLLYTSLFGSSYHNMIPWNSVYFTIEDHAHAHHWHCRAPAARAAGTRRWTSEHHPHLGRAAFRPIGFRAVDRGRRLVDTLMPAAIWAIGLGIFAQGTSELMLAGMLPELATALSITIPQAGLLVSAFAAGMLVGAPATAVLTLRWPRRRALVTFLSIFVAAHVIGALADTYAMLMVVRFVSAFVYAGFWSVGAGTAIDVVAPDRRGRAMSIVSGGLTVATVIGLPAGAWIGQHLGWRATFWTVAAMSTAAMIVLIAAVPPIRPSARVDLMGELRSLADVRLWLSYSLTAVSTAAQLGTFTYLGAMLITTSGLPAHWVPAVLLGYGVGALLGVSIGGQAADRWPSAVLLAGFTALVIVSILMAMTAYHSGAVSVLAFTLGLAGFVINPALNSRAFAIAGSAPTLVAAGTTSAFNVGISAGPWLAGAALSAGFGYASVPVIGAVLGIMSLVLLGIDTAVNRKHVLREPGDERDRVGTRT